MCVCVSVFFITVSSRVFGHVQQLRVICHIKLDLFEGRRDSSGRGDESAIIGSRFCLHPRTGSDPVICV